MKVSFFFLFFSVSAICFSQDVNVIAAKIVDANTNEPVEFVNVGFVDKGIGTISNENGEFSLLYKLSKIKKGDVLQISSIGYETIKLSVSELGRLTSYKVLIPMVPKEYGLDQVVVKSAEREKRTIGHPNVTSAEMGYWRNAEGLGGEIASVIRARKKNTRLLNLKFNIIENYSDSLKIRVNVYDYERGIPGKNILAQNIFHTITKKKGKEVIDLEPYDIKVDNDVVVSIELVEVYGSAIYFALSASAYGGQSFTRELSQDSWKIYKRVGMGFSMDSSFPKKGSEIEIDARPKPERIGLLWDASINLKDRNVKEEMKLLKKYIRSLDKVEVVVSKFSNNILEKRTFPFINGKANKLIEYLEDTNYNGASNYDSLLKNNDDDVTLFLAFTNGKTFYESISSELFVPIFVVNSKDKADHSGLQELASTSNGSYLDLNRISVDKALEYLLYELDDDAKYITENNDLYYGVVYSENKPLENAWVRIKGSYREATTKSDGSFEIEARPGDVLEISALGMAPKDTVVDGHKKINIRLVANRELLDEVLLQQKIEKEKEMVSTPFGKRKSDGVGFSTAKQIKGEDIDPSYTELSQILNWGTGVNVYDYGYLDGGRKRYQFRKFEFASITQSTFAAIVVDGVPYDQNIEGGEPPYVHPRQIETITLLQSALSTIRYGQIAAYGAIVIETKDYARQKNTDNATASALVSGNDYKESVQDLETVLQRQTLPSYLSKIRQTNSLEEAKKVFYEYNSKKEQPIEFFLQTANYFDQLDPDFSKLVLSNIAAIAPENSKALKILAYELEKDGHYKDAQFIYEKIVNLEPGLAQSYRDLAKNYVESGAYEEAGNLYRQMVFNTIPNVDFAGMQDVLLNEFQHLLKKHKSEIKFDDLPTDLLSLDYKQDVRLVLEWTQPTAQFELQFVNPDNKYYSFSHNSFNNEDLLKQELQDGIFMKEFVIDDGEPGRWLINLTSEESTSNTMPLQLKYTRYRNYGLPDEEKIVKIVSLNSISEKVTLDSFINTSD